jgi:hypothetical protein
MTDEHNGGPAGSSEVVEVDLLDPAVATRFAQLARVCTLYFEVFAPAELKRLNDETFQALTLGMLREEMMIDTQIRPLFLPEAANKNQILIRQLQVPGQPPVNFTAKRRHEHCKDAQEVLGQALLVAFTDSPGIRAVLRIHGIQYMWLAPKQSKIILAKG